MILPKTTLVKDFLNFLYAYSDKPDELKNMNRNNGIIKKRQVYYCKEKEAQNRV